MKAPPVTLSRNHKMRGSDADDQTNELVKSKMYVNDVLSAYQQLKAEKHLLQQQLMAVQKYVQETKKPEGNCQMCSATMMELKALQSENRQLKEHLTKEQAEKADWRKRHNSVVQLLRDSQAQLTSAKDELQNMQKQIRKQPSMRSSPADSPRSFLSDVLKRTKASSADSSAVTSISYSVGDNGDDCASPQDQYIAAFLHPQSDDAEPPCRSTPQKPSFKASHAQDTSVSSAHGSMRRSSGWGLSNQEHSNPLQFSHSESRRSTSKQFDYYPLHSSNSRASANMRDDHSDQAMASPDSCFPIPETLSSDAALSAMKDRKNSGSGRLFPNIPGQHVPNAVSRQSAVWSAQSNADMQNSPSSSLPGVPPAAPSLAGVARRASNTLYTVSPESSLHHSRQSKISDPHTQSPFSQPTFPSSNSKDDSMEDDLPYHCVQPALPNWKAVHVGHMHPPQVLRVHVSPADQECIMDAEVYEGEVATTEPEVVQVPPAPAGDARRSSLHSFVQQTPQVPSSSGISSAHSSEEMSNQTVDLVGSLLQSLRGGLGDTDTSTHKPAVPSALQSAPSMPAMAYQQQVKAQLRRQESGSAADGRVRGGGYMAAKAAKSAPQFAQWAAAQPPRDQNWQSTATQGMGDMRAYQHGPGAYAAQKELQSRGFAQSAEVAQLARRLHADRSFL